MRVARVINPGAVYHFISRFVDERWFIRDDDERARYIALCDKAIATTDWRWLSYAVMSNHFHHAFVAGEQPLEHLAKPAHSPFARWMNERYGRLGPLFADRPNVREYRDEHVPRLIGYIHNNPVRAGVVKHASESSWTSHRAYLGLERPPRSLDVEHGLMRCDFDGLDFDAGITRCHELEISAPLAEIQRAAHKRGAVEVGTARMEPTVVPLVARPFGRIRPDPREILEAVAVLTRLPRLQIASRRVDGAFVSARRTVVHCGVELGLSAADMGAALGITRQAAARYAKQSLTAHERAVVAAVYAAFDTSSTVPG